MPATVAQTLAAVRAITEILAEVDARNVVVNYVAADVIVFTEIGTDGVCYHDRYSVEEAEENALDLGVLGEDVQADPGPYHPDTRAAFGIAHYEVITLGDPIEVVEITA